MYKLQSTGKLQPPTKQTRGVTKIAQHTGKDWAEIDSYFVLGLRGTFHVLFSFLFSSAKCRYHNTGKKKKKKKKRNGFAEKRRLSVDLVVE